VEKIIWTKKELVKIRQIILNKTNYVLGKNNLLIKNDRNTNLSEVYNGNTIYSDSISEIKKLFYMQDREKITSMLTYLNNVKADYNNPLHFGLIACLDKIDIEDHTYIFEILKQIISQYERIISSVVKNNITGLNKIELANKISSIEHSKEMSEEEKQIKRTMDEILNVASVLNDVEPYSSLIKRIQKNLKNKLLYSLNFELSKKEHREIFNKNIDVNCHNIDYSNATHHQRTLRKKTLHGYIYR